LGISSAAGGATTMSLLPVSTPGVEDAISSCEAIVCSGGASASGTGTATPTVGGATGCVTATCGGGSFWVSGGGAASGKVTMQDFHFVTRVNKASPLLFLSCATGKHIKEAILTARKAGKDQQEFLVFKFSDVLISSYQIGGAEAADIPMDQVSFNFGRVDFEYRAQKPDGSLASPVKAGWDVKKSRQV